MVQFLVLLAVLAVATAGGLVWRARDGRLRPGRAGRRHGAAEPAGPWAALGVPLGARATLVQFSSAFCQPCRATRRILSEVAEMIDGVSYAEIDAELHLDAVRELGVLRTPTTFVLDATGAVVRRASGQPRKSDVIAAIGVAVASAEPA